MNIISYSTLHSIFRIYHLLPPTLMTVLISFNLPSLFGDFYISFVISKVVSRKFFITLLDLMASATSPPLSPTIFQIEIHLENNILDNCHNGIRVGNVNRIDSNEILVTIQVIVHLGYAQCKL